MLKRKIVSPLSFGLVAVAFFFSFLNLESNSISIGNISGMGLVTGAQKTGNAADETQKPSTNPEAVPAYVITDSNYFAIAAMLLATGGMVLSLLFFLQQEMLLGIIGFSGLLSMLLLRLQIDSMLAGHLVANSNHDLRIDYAPGYWIAIVFFLIAGLSNLSVYIDQLSAPYNGKENRTR